MTNNVVERAGDHTGFLQRHDGHLTSDPVDIDIDGDVDVDVDVRESPRAAGYSIGNSPFGRWAPQVRPGPQRVRREPAAPWRRAVRADPRSRRKRVVPGEVEGDPTRGRPVRQVVEEGPHGRTCPGSGSRSRLRPTPL
jgi:hypothetical protein